ncbi:MAG: hypothetical protein B5M56_00745 [Desulfococcus sp. 4484_241]|nr:MAG: hypothetical protein B5M56_00745 [Desulfococcus sp. 4484_241]
MLALTRERISAHLQKVPILIDLYQKHDSMFINRTVMWLFDLEKILLQVKDPLASFVAIERGKFLAISDGYRDPSSQTIPTTKRKSGLVTAMIILEKVETALLKKIDDIDSKFEIWREKMAQFIAVATNSHPIPLPPKEPRQSWLEEIWCNFSVTVETQSMYNYLNTVMHKSDRLYLLNELIENTLNGDVV